MAKINLFFLADVKYGGFVTFTAHLYRALEQRGHTPRVFKVGKTTERKTRVFCGRIPYQNVSLDTATTIVTLDKNLITCANWKQHSGAIEMILATGAGMVFHDPTEFHPELLETLRVENRRVVVIREVNRANLAEHNVKSIFIKHPYVPLHNTHMPPAVQGRSISISRVDWDKHTELIVEADRLLPSPKRIIICGPINRIYDYHKLRVIDPDWQRNYEGKLPLTEHAATSILGGYSFVVDMSAIKKDGCGSQYTFLEAFDANRPLIISAGWLSGHARSALHPGKTVFVADGVEELVSRLRKGITPMAHRVAAEARKILDEHCHERIVPEYEQYMHSGR